MTSRLWMLKYMTEIWIPYGYRLKYRCNGVLASAKINFASFGLVSFSGVGRYQGHHRVTSVMQFDNIADALPSTG